MGEAKRRGTYESRRKNAIRRDKTLLTERLGSNDKRLFASLRVALKPFLKRMSKEQWKERRLKLLDNLKAPPENRSGSANLHKPLSGKSATKKALKWA